MNDAHEKPPGEPERWLDRPGSVRKIVIGLFVVCGLLFVADAFYKKHPHFDIETIFGFHAIYGFVMCVALVLAARLMRVFLMRGEDYYDRDD